MMRVFKTLGLLLSSRRIHDSARTFPQKRLALTFGEDAGVAQLAERLLCKQQVARSIRAVGSNTNRTQKKGPSAEGPLSR